MNKVIQEKKDSIPIKKLNKTAKSAIKIISTIKEIDSPARVIETDSIACFKWSLTKRNIQDIFSYSHPISGTEMDLAYAVYPCNYSGKVEVDGVLASYKVNPASFITLWTYDTTIYLGCTSKHIRKYFLDPPYDK